jgi:hypothetical protein
MLTPLPAPLLLHMLAEQADCTDPGVDHPCQDCRTTCYALNTSATNKLLFQAAFAGMHVLPTGPGSCTGFWTLTGQGLACIKR